MGINNKIKNKISFVILHYLAFQDTIECIDSIISNYDRLCYEIVVVDNYSNNGSQEKLEIYYSGQNNIYFLKMGYNSGFAKGNNYGYQYAKKYLKPNYIILLNNDTILNQKDFLIKIDEIYQSAKFDILGPDIVSLSNNLHQNPMALFGINKENLGETIKTTRKLIIQN